MNMKIRLAAALTAASLMSAPVSALALGTTPLGLRAQAEETGARERLPAFTGNRDYKGVRASREWLYQARLGGRLLSLRLHTATGDQVTFQENLGSDGADGIELALRASDRDGGLLLQMDQDAVDTLIALGITRIVVTDMDMVVQDAYMTEDLAAMRSLFELGERELLCVSGEEDPVTVVSEDGVRRQITE